MKPMSLLALPLLLLTGCPFGPVPGPPPPDDCSSPGALDGIEEIEVGTIDPRTDDFVPWPDDTNVETTLGGQGGSMLGVVLSLRGSDLPACVQHTMELHGSSGIEPMARTDYPVRTYSGRDDTRVTTTVWLIFSGETPFQEQVWLTLRIGDLELTRSLLVEAALPMNLVVPATLSAGAPHVMAIHFDRAVYEPVDVTVTSSNPALLRPLEPSFQSRPENPYAPVLAELEAVAPGGPVTISVTANGKTLTTSVSVTDPAGQ